MRAKNSCEYADITGCLDEYGLVEGEDFTVPDVRHMLNNREYIKKRIPRCATLRTWSTIENIPKRVYSIQESFQVESYAR